MFTTIRRPPSILIHGMMSVIFAYAVVSLTTFKLFHGHRNKSSKQINAWIAPSSGRSFNHNPVAVIYLTKTLKGIIFSESPTMLVGWENPSTNRPRCNHLNVWLRGARVFISDQLSMQWVNGLPWQTSLVLNNVSIMMNHISWSDLSIRLRQH
jgi:hypothetical protein